MAHFIMPRTISLDLPDKALEKLELNKEVEVRVRGKVRVLEAEYEPDEDEIEMGAPENGAGMLVLQVLDVNIEGLDNEIANFDKELEEAEE